MRRHRNAFSRAAARVLAWAHTRAPMIRWLLLAGLIVIWIVAGFIGWHGGHFTDDDGHVQTIGIADAIYRTIGALSMQDIYVPANVGALNVARFAGLGVPVIGILFAFWGELGRSLAQGLYQFASRHIVVAGAGAAAVHLALDCRRARDTVALIGAGLSDDQVWSLRRQGVFVVETMAADRMALRHARAHRAAHVVAFEDDDTSNLQIEAAMRALVGDAKRDPPIAVHVSTQSAPLLQEARLMHAQKARGGAIEAKPFSLDEIAARALLQREVTNLLDVAAGLRQERVHLLCVGFPPAAMAVAARLFMSVWSSSFEAPRVTVASPDPSEAEALFRAHYPQAFANPELWAADIVFRGFDWRRTPVNGALIESFARDRGAPTAILVAADDDPDTIRLALALKRACNEGEDAPTWPIPIYLKETSKSEFTAVYAAGRQAPGEAYLLAFGALQDTATRATIVEGRQDRAAAIAHSHYHASQKKRGVMSMRDLQALERDWDDVQDTYRAANRAVSDAAMVKMWDAGWRVAEAREKDSDTAPQMTPAQVDAMAQREHDRWMAERLMAGWRPGAKRNNGLMVHDKLAPWEALTEDDKENDRVQVRAAVDIARLMHPAGFKVRS